MENHHRIKFDEKFSSYEEFSKALHEYENIVNQKYVIADSRRINRKNKNDCIFSWFKVKCEHGLNSQL